MKIFRTRRWVCAVLVLFSGLGSFAQALDLTRAVIVTRGPLAVDVERLAAQVLIEEVEKRSGIRWTITEDPPDNTPIIAITANLKNTEWADYVPSELRNAYATLGPEGFALASGRMEIGVLGADARGALFGVGRLLTSLEMRKGSVILPGPLRVITTPAYPIRGHQLGYRNRANSYDAWDAAQYERYIRELALFGANCIENIPFEDETPSPHMRAPRDEMNIILGQICEKYDMDYWVWTPAEFDLADTEKRAALIARHEAFYKACPRLDAVFFPGGDPGNNHPRLVAPFLADLAPILQKYHPKAKLWLSLQGFDRAECEWFLAWLEAEMPDWFGGVVAGPGSPPIPLTRERVPAKYALRHYPDITHAVRCQYPTDWLDPAFAFTLGREPVNPEPVYYALIHNYFAPYTDGFLTYSDGIHDDVNKTVWSMRGWDPDIPVRDILMHYTRFFFGPDVAEAAADGIRALEQNWDGPLAENGAVTAALALWQSLETGHPELAGNWRWELCLLRAYYDAYTRARLLYETRLEEMANEALAKAPGAGAAAAMDEALAILRRADEGRVRPELRERVFELCESLFHSIGYQTSVERYGASGAERGAILDFIDHPLNNRWWLEDEFEKIRAMTSEEEKLARLELIRTWENPGPGSFYDDVGNVAKSPHVIRGEGLNTDPLMIRNPNPDFMWWDNGKSRQRLSWISKMDWPIGLRYEGLDPKAKYMVRTTGLGQGLLRVDGERVVPEVDGKDIGEFKIYHVPQEALKDGALVLTWDVPYEPGINWRQASRLSEVWLLKRPASE